MIFQLFDDRWVQRFCSNHGPVSAGLVFQRRLHENVGKIVSRLPLALHFLAQIVWFARGVNRPAPQETRLISARIFHFAVMIEGQQSMAVQLWYGMFAISLNHCHSDPRAKAAPAKVARCSRYVINNACESGNAYAYIARAQLSDQFDADWETVARDLDEAVRLAPDDSEMNYFRGMRFLQHKNYQRAISDFSCVIEKNSPRMSVPPAYLQRALCFLNLGERKNALSDISVAAKLQPNNPHIRFHLAKILYLTQHYAEAETELADQLRASAMDYDARIFSAHVAAAQGRVEEADSILHSLERSGLPHMGFYFNLAEAYMVVDARQTLRVLSENKPNGSEEVAAHCILKAIAAEIIGDAAVRADAWEVCERHGADIAALGWDFFELREFLRWGVAQNRLTAERAEAIESMIRFFENAGRPEQHTTANQEQLALG